MNTQSTNKEASPHSKWNFGHFLLFTLTLTCLAGCKPGSSTKSPQTRETNIGIPDHFLSLMNVGKNHLDQGDTDSALAIYNEAAALVPNDPDVHMNLANVHLLNDAGADALREADLVLNLEPNSAAAYFVKGSAYLRLLNPEEAVKALENSLKIDHGVTATFFQLGLARMGLDQWEEAIAAFKEGLRLDPNRLHASAHYLLARSLIQAGRHEEAQRELELHQPSIEGEGPRMGAATFERSKHTRARVPFKLDQPDQKGIDMKFHDATQQTLGEAAHTFSGPIGLIDLNHQGWSSLFVVEKSKGFRLLKNLNGNFTPHSEPIPFLNSHTITKVLIGDLQNDRSEDVLILGTEGSQTIKITEDGSATNVTLPSHLNTLEATDGILMDLDFTGKLDLVAVTTNKNELQILRQTNALSFTNITSSSGVPVTLENATMVVMEDWNHDQVMDIIVNRSGLPPLLLEKQRGGTLTPIEQEQWVSGTSICAGDFDNDLRPDLAILTNEGITICFNSGQRNEWMVPDAKNFHTIIPVDFDNDGWLDLWTIGDTIQAWRNRGLSGFKDQTAKLGLDAFNDGPVSEIHFADFDHDCDSDVIVALSDGGLRYFENDGGNANAQIKVQMVGNRSNASGLGCKIVIETGGLRLIRTVHQLPVEVGIGNHQQLDSFLVHWFNWAQGSAKIPVNCQEPLLALELTIQEGSCPYLYAWDGKGFRFITDILGSAPLGLPIAEGRYIDANPEEYVWVGNEQTFLVKDGAYQIRITEELREALYLDEIKLAVVDRQKNQEIHSTDKLLPSAPYPDGSLITVHKEYPLLKANDLEGREITSVLKAVDSQRVSPSKLRASHLRGLAEPHGCILDFGPIDVSKPLILVMNGWLRFGGGMANIAASQDASLPFPFPVLEAETSSGNWSPIDVSVGAPSGKTKTIVVDLEGKLAKGTKRIKLTTAFEIHWDRIALMEKVADPKTKVHFEQPSAADLHYRGFSKLKDLPADWPLTPDYNQVTIDSYWTLIPGGWCTRYGDVMELIQSRDEGLLLLNSGDELVLKFATDSLPPKPEGSVREFFLYADGWDKDSDFHVANGTLIEPLPFHGMDDQNYNQMTRPKFPSDSLHQKYNTRWVEGTGFR
ncbi:MAG: tetratricopeptide repeat protein [Verrucomicrobia bacterium]|nr:tetratricopeptide repeat protein [Verrucomicrobiota bacterium]